jgi:hypothetical protein
MKTNSFVVKDAHRKRERDLKDSLKRDLVAYISEILTNADDSYRRLENANLISKDEVKKIVIEIKEDRRKKGEFVVSITDQAEGMSEDELRSKFKDYGADKAEGQLHTRGLFGQGAADVLFNASSEQRTAIIESFKDGKLTKAKFNYDKNDQDLKKVEFEPVERKGSQLNNIRQSLGIKDNGTKVTFGIPSRVKFNPKSIVNEIEAYPFFKFLLNNPFRKVILKLEHETVEHHLSSANYQLEDKPLFKKDFSISYKNYTLQCKLTLWKIDKKVIKNDILIIDDHQVIYDDHFFGFDTNPKAKSLGGFLEIKDFYKVLRNELNAEDPIAIITDNRKGFDTSQEFYQLLKAEVIKIINPKLDEFGDEIDEVDISSNKKISEMIKRLNSYFVKNMPEEIPYSGKEKGILPPEKGLAFVRDEMSLTVSKKYMIILLINAKMVSDQTPIKLISENLNIISLSQESISFKKEEANMYGLVIKRFLIEAKAFSNEPVRITANSGILYCHALIKPIEYEIHYPDQGLEFYPHRIKHKPDRNHMGYLYVDVKQFEPGKTIFIEAEEPFVYLEVKQITLKDTDFDSNGIAMFKIQFTGGELGDRYSIYASIDDTKTSLRVEIKEPSKKDTEGTLGLISSIKFHSDYDNKHEQAKFSKTDKVLMINRVNPINKAMWSNINFLKDFNNVSPKQLNYLLDLCSYHGALQIVEYQMSHHDFMVNKDSFTLLESKIYQIKTDIFEIIKNDGVDQ